MTVSQLTKESTVVLAKSSAPNVKLDDKFYKLVDKMEVRRCTPVQSFSIRRVAYVLSCTLKRHAYSAFVIRERACIRAAASGVNRPWS